jgi:hypothetical protein
MADVTLHILTAATTADLITLAEAKLMLGISATDSSEDAQLQMMISMQSATIAELCNRVFARERLSESWREIETDSMGQRVFLTHWPVDPADIESVSEDGSTDLVSPDWELEERSGKLSRYGGWAEPAVITYTGGYDLPTEAPMPLKQAAVLLVREQRRQIKLGNLEGIRSLSHKSARVQFVDPTRLLSAGIGPAGVQSSVRALLTNFARHWV